MSLVLWQYLWPASSSFSERLQSSHQNPGIYRPLFAMLSFGCKKSRFHLLQQPKQRITMCIKGISIELLQLYGLWAGMPIDTSYMMTVGSSDARACMPERVHLSRSMAGRCHI